MIKTCFRGIRLAQRRLLRLVRVAFRVCSPTQHVNLINYSGNYTHQTLFDTLNLCGLPTQSVFVFCMIFATRTDYCLAQHNRLVLPLVTHSVLCEVCIHNVAESRSSIAGLSPRLPGFSTVSGYMRFVVDKVAVGQALVRVLLFLMPVLFRQCSIIIFALILALSEGQAGESWELSFLGAFCTEKPFDIPPPPQNHKKQKKGGHSERGRKGQTPPFSPPR